MFKFKVMTKKDGRTDCRGFAKTYTDAIEIINAIENLNKNSFDIAYIVHNGTDIIVDTVNKNR